VTSYINKPIKKRALYSVEHSFLFPLVQAA